MLVSSNNDKHTTHILKKNRMCETHGNNTKCIIYFHFVSQTLASRMFIGGALCVLANRNMCAELLKEHYLFLILNTTIWNNNIRTKPNVFSKCWEIVLYGKIIILLLLKSCFSLSFSIIKRVFCLFFRLHLWLCIWTLNVRVSCIYLYF